MGGSALNAINTLQITAYSHSGQDRLHVKVITKKKYSLARQMMCLVLLLKLMFVIPVGDGRLGYPEGAPYSAIHVGAAAPTIPEAVSQMSILLTHQLQIQSSLLDIYVQIR